MIDNPSPDSAVERISGSIGDPHREAAAFNGRDPLAGRSVARASLALNP